MRIIAVIAFALALASCGGEAKLGEGCDTPSGEGECEAGTICTNTSGGDNICRKICVDQAGCGAGENCNGVSGSSTKSCQPG